MSNHISLTIPRDDEKALIAASTLLLTLAGKIPPLELDNYREGTCSLIDDDGGCMAADGRANPTIYPAPITVNNVAPVADPGVQSMSAGEAVPPTPPGVDPLTQIAPPPAYVPPVPAATTPPAGVEVDKNGLPWDARIHSGTKAKNADGTWKYKRGVDRETEVPAVEAELRALMAIPVAAPAPVAGVPVVPAPVETPVAEVPVVPVAPVQTPAPVAEVPVVPAPVETPPDDMQAPTTFPEFLRKVTARINAGTLSMDHVNAVNAEHGIDRMAALAARPDLIPQIWNAVING